VTGTSCAAVAAEVVPVVTAVEEAEVSVEIALLSGVPELSDGFEGVLFVQPVKRRQMAVPMQKKDRTIFLILISPKLLNLSRYFLILQKATFSVKMPKHRMDIPYTIPPHVTPSF